MKMSVTEDMKNASSMGKASVFILLVTSNLCLLLI
jgi:hypothetical protein